MTEPLVSIGIVTWNSADFLPACLQAISVQTYPNIELIIVDNNSTDQSLQIVSIDSPLARVIKNKENLGFCGAHNQAIHSSTGKYYFPLNPDVVMERDYITAAVRAIESDEKIGMVATRLYLGTPEKNIGLIDSTGLFIDRKRRQFLRGFNQQQKGMYLEQEEVFGVDGAAPLYRREMLEDISFGSQYFDELFFAHKEDVDICWRARLFGWKCIYTPESIAFHQRNFKPGMRRHIGEDIKLHAIKNRYLLLLKNETAVSWRRDWPLILWYDLKIFIYILFFERSSLAAISIIRKNWPRIMAWRQFVQSHTKATDSEILNWFK